MSYKICIKFSSKNVGVMLEFEMVYVRIVMYLRSAFESAHDRDRDRDMSRYFSRVGYQQLLLNVQTERSK